MNRRMNPFRGRLDNSIAGGDDMNFAALLNCSEKSDRIISDEWADEKFTVVTREISWPDLSFNGSGEAKNCHFTDPSNSGFSRLTRLRRASSCSIVSISSSGWPGCPSCSNDVRG